MNSTAYLPLMGSVVLNTCGQLCAKMGASMPLNASLGGYIVQVATTPFLVLAMVCYAASLLLWVVVLSKCEISVAASVFSASYLLTVLMGIVIFKEPISLLKVMGFMMIMGGIYLVSSRT